MLPFILEVEAAGRAGRGASAALDLEHRTRGYRSTIDRGALRDQPEAVARLAGVIDRQLRGNLVSPGRDMHRPVVGYSAVDRRLDRTGVVVAVVAHRTIAAHVDPRPARAHHDVAAERGRAGRRQRR